MMAHRDVVRTLQLLVYYYMDVVYRCACAGDVVDVVRAVVSGLSACACWREPLRYEECLFICRRHALLVLRRWDMRCKQSKM